MPGPRSSHHDLPVPAEDGDHLARGTPFAGVVQQVAHGAREAVVVCGDPTLLGGEVERHALRAPVGGGQSDRVADEQVEAEGFLADGHLVPRGQLGQVPHQVGQLLQLHQDIVDQDRAIGLREFVDPPDDLEVGAQAGERRAELVGGVHDQLGLGPAGELEGLEQTVEGAAEASELVGATWREAAGDVGGLGQVLDGVGEGVERHQRGLGHQPPQHHREENPDQGDGAQHNPQAFQFGAHVEQGGDLEGPALGEIERPEEGPGGRGSTSSRSWSPPTSTVVKKDGASPAATSRAWGVIGRSPPETSVPCESMTCPSVAVVVLICWPAVIFLAAAVRDSSAAPSSELRAARNEAVEATSTATTTATVVARTRRVRKVTCPRRMYPTPRTVWMHRGSPPASVLRRR